MSVPSALTTWALPKLSSLLPIDNESLNEILAYTLTLSKPAAGEHLKNLLGDSPQALEFISAFNSRRGPVPGDEQNPSAAPSPSPGSAETDTGKGNQTQGRNKKKSKAPLHNAGPTRRPEGYGNVGGGYNKTNLEDEYYVPGGGSRSNRPSRPSSISNLTQLADKPDAIQAPHTITSSTGSPAHSHPTSNLPSRTASPAPNTTTPKLKQPPGASGLLISDHLFANVRSRTLQPPKAKSHPSSTSASPSRKPNSSSSTTTVNETDSISDLSSAISLLERTTNPSKPSTKRETCTCNATLHPLFTPAPNCLSCGKIICALEGSTLAPCSFCNTPLFTPSQVQAMISALREERGLEKVAAHNAALQPHLPIFPSNPNSGTSTPTNSALTAAESHKNKLLNFQRENARRTRVLDEVADFSTQEVTAWMSPVERAKALKAQQRFRREQDERNKPEWERKKTVLSLDVSGGKVRRTYNRVEPSFTPQSDDSDEGSEQNGLEIEATKPGTGKSGQFARNPLLVDKSGNITLVRPIWTDRSKGKAAATDGNVENDEEPRKERDRGMWRRVQDDNEDEGEKWVLDGGLRGFEREEGG